MNFLKTITMALIISASLCANAQNKIIDIQSHYLPPQWIAELSARTEYPFLEKINDKVWIINGSPHERLPYQTAQSAVDLNAKIAEMDANGIAVSLLSLSLAGPDNAPTPDEAERLARIANDGIAEAVALYPDRFRGVATLGLGNINQSLSELQRCVEELGFVGLQLFPYVGGRKATPLDELKPIFAYLEANNIPLLLHPGSPVNPDYANYFLGGFMGYWFDDAMFITKFILSGTLDEYPNLKVVLPHTWSIMPYLMSRLDYQVPYFAKQFPDIKAKKLPSEYLKNIYTDACNFSSDDLRYAIQKMGGTDRIMFGSDSPFIPTQFVVDILKGTELPEEDLQKIYSENARKLFNIKF